MKIVYTLQGGRARDTTTELLAPATRDRPPRVTCLLALAHRLEELVQSGEVNDYADLARLGRVSRARISQILNLLLLAPSIQEHLLLLPSRAAGVKSITERDLRQVIREPRWDRQCVLFEQLLRPKGYKI